MSRFTYVHWNKQGVAGDRLIKWGALGLGLVKALSATLGVFLMLGFVVAITDLPAYNFSMVIMLTMLAAAFLGGKGAGEAARIRGWQHGAMTGLVYGMLFVMLGILLGMTIFDPVLMTLSMIIIGILGGIFGVNSPAARLCKRSVK